MVMEKNKETNLKKKKKKLVALTVMKIMDMALRNNLYQLNEKIYLQLEGGSIGDNLTQIAGMMTMFTFVDRYRKKLVRLSLFDQVVVLKIYVDNLSQWGFCLPFA